MASREDDKEEAQRDKPAYSPNDLTPYRQTAQQNSIDALRAAEERSEKAKQPSAAALGKTKEAAVHGLGAKTAYVAEKGAQAKDYTAEKGQQGLHAAKEGAVGAGQTAAEKGQQGLHAAKEGVVRASQTAAEKGQRGLHVVKDTAVSAGRKAADYTQQAAGQTKEYLTEKGQQAKDTVVEAGFRAVDYAEEKAGQAKDAVSGQKDEETKQAHGEQQTRGTEVGKLDIGKGRADDIPAQDIRDIDYSKPVKERYDENTAAETQESREKENRGSLLEAVGETVIDIAKSTKNLVIGRGDD